MLEKAAQPDNELATRHDLSLEKTSRLRRIAVVFAFCVPHVKLMKPPRTVSELRVDLLCHRVPVTRLAKCM